MRVCVLYAGASRDCEKLKAVSESLARGIESNGHSCDVFNMALEGGRKVSFYDYLVIGTESTTFLGGKIPDTVRTFLKNAGTVSGKRCMGFVTKGFLRSGRTLQVLMKAMEGEGMYLRSSEIIAKREIAESIGKRLKISR